MSLLRGVILLWNLHPGLRCGTGGGIFIFCACGAGASTRCASLMALSPCIAGGMLQMNPMSYHEFLCVTFMGSIAPPWGFLEGAFLSVLARGTMAGG